jgi:glutaredoxin
MVVKFHRCPLTWLKVPFHSCHRVQKALDAAGIEYDEVIAPVARPKREEVKRLTGQEKLPVIEFADGSAYREESKDMAATIAAGQLFEKASGSAPSAGSTPGA